MKNQFKRTAKFKRFLTKKKLNMTYKKGKALRILTVK